MNTSWMVLADGRGSWMLVEVYTRRLIPLPSINTALLWHRVPEYSESYSSQHDTKFDLLKVVICQVPTRSVNYKDFRLIAFFNRGLVYLTGHWSLLVSLPFLIPEPFKEKRHGSCRWFLARSDDGERLMIVHRMCCFGNTITVTARSLSGIPASLGL
ncbi:hypothetical protein VPH35_087544 [Triticum aestivum]|uniref:Uncharacterized protein n=1 Tax=Triticum aestivum TaxID=4565 RepID=B6Z270_WHEAT|nr:hypothetical protein [Triticum aestivum]